MEHSLSPKKRSRFEVEELPPSPKKRSRFEVEELPPSPKRPPFEVEEVPVKRCRFEVDENEEEEEPPEEGSESEEKVDSMPFHLWEWESFVEEEEPEGDSESEEEVILSAERIPYFMQAISNKDILPRENLGQGIQGTVDIYSYQGKSYIVKQLRTGHADTADNCRVENEIKLLSEIRTTCEKQFSCLLGWGKIPLPTENLYLLFFPMNESYSPLSTITDVESFFKTKGYNRGFKVCLNLATALNHLHQMKFAHRDIKPQNLLVDLQTLQIKYIDFGSSCQEIEYGPSCTLACAEVAKLSLGTPGYFAPEQGWAIQPTAPFKCDIWSLGIVFYNLLEGKTPWGDDLYLPKFQSYFINTPLIFFGPTKPDYYCIPDSAFSPESASVERFCKIIQDMTCLNPQVRPSMEEVVTGLKSVIRSLR